MKGERRVVFFDRDGIVNRPPDPERYVTAVEGFHVFPAFVNALRVVRERGYEAVVATNQRGVALGCMSMQTVNAIHAELIQRLAREGLRLLDILVSTADRDEDPRRKPNPGMLLEAAALYGVDLGRSWMIGNSEKDVVAGERAGCRTVLVRPGSEASVADYRLASVEELAGFLNAHLPEHGPGVDADL